jgi:peptidoglycan/LPS O-acetylase OafA/YrhL
MIATSAAWLAAHTPLRSGEHAGYRADIDGLRAVAVMAVVIHHIAPGLLHGGYVGVDVFFVISGYLITQIIHAEQREGRFSFMEFYARRARRILPALFGVLLATLALGWWLQLPSDYRGTLRAALAALLSVSNLLFWSTNRGYFEATDERLNPLLHTWSLGVEEQFYLFFPLLLLAWLRMPRCLRAPAFILAGFASLLIAQALVRRFPGEVFYLLPFRAWEFLVGSALALGMVPNVQRAWARSLLYALGLGAIGWSCVAYSDSTAFPGASALLPVLGAAAVIHAGRGSISGLGRVLAWRPVVFTGLVSYSLYLWHWPVLVFADYVGLVQPGWSGGLVVFAVSFGMAVLSYRFIEQPFRRRQPGQLRLRLALAGSLTGVLALGAVAGEHTRGFTGRFPEAVVRLDDDRGQRGDWRPCFGRGMADACLLGAREVPSDALLWGDSHALSWAPALDEELKKAGRSALLVSTAGCAPVAGARIPINPRCDARNAEVIAGLQAAEGIRTVILTGYWSTYFRVGGPIQFTPPASEGPAAPQRGIEAASAALRTTVERLLAEGREVVLIGPVPAYSRSVPAAMALERALGLTLLDRSVGKQQVRHAPFFEALAGMASNESLQVLNPLEWLCSEGECRVLDEDESLYRDAHHLNARGAQRLATHIGMALSGRAAAPH